jgi:hypothetical protein
MHRRTVSAVIGLGLASLLVVVPGVAAGGLGQAPTDPAGLEAPGPVGETETPFGCAATAAELPTGSPGLVEGDLGATEGPGVAGTGMSAETILDPAICPSPAEL